MRDGLTDFISCLMITGAYCESEGWDGFKEYLNKLSDLMGSERRANDGDRSDIMAAIVIMRALLQSPDLLDLIVDRALKERGRSYNLYWEGETEKGWERK
jgi:hypothetical protein